jgi:hypothetical protein
MSERTAIVTIALGPGYAERWRRVCERNWREYAERHGYDVICLDQPLDDSERAQSRSPSWQKLLVPGQPFAEEYERLIWVDVDAVFSPGAPAITEGVPAERVGAVDERAQMTPEVERVVHRVPDPRGSYYGDFGLPSEFDQVVQAGVLVLSPENHRELFRHVYDSYEDRDGMYYEMRPLSWELLNAGLVTWLDPRFNQLWFLYRARQLRTFVGYGRHPRIPELVEEARKNVYLLHFAGEVERMEFSLGLDRERSAPRRRPAPPAESPVALFMWRRPDTTARVLDAIRAARPRKLLAVANAPRPGVEGEQELCERTQALLETVDWPCEVSTEVAASHLSQTERIESGLDWVFGQTDRVIVLEDDCVPNPSFFRYCDEMLERYRDAERVMTVSGNNFQFEEPASDDSYYFSRFPQIWGWATWRRAWEGHDREMAAWPELRESGWLERIFDEPSAAAYWAHMLETNYRDRGAWDRSWLLTSLLRDAVHAIPNVNLVTNVGFREDATHTRPEYAGLFADLPTEPLEFPLRHPASLEPNSAADEYTDRLQFGGNVTSMLRRARYLRRLSEASA